MSAERTTERDGKKRGRAQWIPWAIFFLAVAFAGGVVWMGRDRVGAVEESLRSLDTGPRTARSDLVVLYFGDPDRVGLRPELRTISAGDPLVERMRACVRELAAGSLERAVDVLPPGARLRGAFLDTWGVAYLDFNREILGSRPPDDGEEWLVVASIVRTLCDNFPEIHAVRILIEGEMVVSLAGYMDLEEPLRAEDFVDAVGSGR